MISRSVIFIATEMFLIRCLCDGGISDLISICSPFILFFVHVQDLVLFLPKCFSTLIRINWTVFKSCRYLSPTPAIFSQSVCTWMWVLLFFSQRRDRVENHCCTLSPAVWKIESLYSQTVLPSQPLTFLTYKLIYPFPIQHLNLLHPQTLICFSPIHYSPSYMPTI